VTDKPLSTRSSSVAGHVLFQLRLATKLVSRKYVDQIPSIETPSARANNILALPIIPAKGESPALIYCCASPDLFCFFCGCLRWL
jgi:hypothetical protein